MIENIKQMVLQEIDRILKKKYLYSNRVFYVFGAGEIARVFLERCADILSIAAIVDNDKSKIGKKFEGITIVEPQTILLDKRQKYIIVTSSYVRQISNQLLSMGFEYDKDFEVIYLNTNFRIGDNFFGAFIKVIRKSLSAFKGYSIFRNLCNKYSLSSNDGIILCPYEGMGDTYMTMALLESYRNENKMNRFIILVIKNSHHKIVKMFNYSFVEAVVINDNRKDELLSFAQLLENNKKLLVANPAYPKGNKANVLSINRSISFADAFKINVFNLNKECQISVPDIKTYEEEAIKYIEDNNIVKNKSVIIVPYAKSTSNLDNSFWEALVQTLTLKGYSVFTNVGSKEEVAIKGTIPLGIPLEYIIPVINYSGWVIANRSGLCEIFSSSNAKKTIIYPQQTWHRYGTVYDYFSLNKMQITTNSDEFIVSTDIDAYEELIEKIIKSRER